MKITLTAGEVTITIEGVNEKESQLLKVISNTLPPEDKREVVFEKPVVSEKPENETPDDPGVQETPESDTPAKKRTPFNAFPKNSDKECTSCHRKNQRWVGELCQACFARKRYAEKHGKEFVPGLPGKKLAKFNETPEPKADDLEWVNGDDPDGMLKFIFEALEGNEHAGLSGDKFKCDGCDKKCIVKGKYKISGEYESFHIFKRKFREKCWERYGYEPPMLKEGEGK